MTWLNFTRWYLPGAFILVGIGLLVSGGDSEGGAGVFSIGAGLMIGGFNQFVRVGFQSNVDREHEEAAREYFDRTGRWPEDDPT